MRQLVSPELITEEDIARAILSSLCGEWPQDEKDLLAVIRRLFKAGNVEAPGNDETSDPP